MKRIAVYAPLELGGANFPSNESLQDQMGIQHFVLSVQWGKELDTDIRIVLSQAQLYSGLCTPFLEDCSTITSPYGRWVATPPSATADIPKW
jgi:hypothetical protein